ncbi:hypothetical protein [Anaerofustis butyriciformans]|uniref:hypothetical protein n=1 Tax=Anaerofustis butyriciformans TaxID=3108533 RepID=UPI002E360A41|nr:hypothetical protein [Anaerofustis sp. HA2171]
MNKLNKKVISILFSSLLVVSLVGCGNNETMNTTPIKSSTEDTGFFTQEVVKRYTVSKTVYPNEVAKTKKTFDETFISQNNQNANIVMELTEIKESEDKITDRKVKVTSETNFTYDVNVPNADKTKIITYYDNGLEPSKDVINVDKQQKKNGDKAVKVAIKVKELQVVDDWSWRNGFNPTMQFKGYGSALYQIDETHYLKHNLDGSVPDITGKEEALVNYLDLPTDKYRINSIKWVGKEFTKGGVTYRNAIANGQRYQAKYKAIYEQEIELPDAKAVKLTAVYTWRGIEINKSHVVMAVIAGAVLLAGLIAIIIMLLKKKKNKNQDEDDEEQEMIN